MFILPSPSSWALELSVEDEAAGAPQPPSCRSPPLNKLSLFFENLDLFFVSLGIFFHPQTFSWRSDLAVRSRGRVLILGDIELSHILSLALFPVLSKKRVQVTTKADADVPRRLRAPYPQRPTTAHFPNTFR